MFAIAATQEHSLWMWSVYIYIYSLITYHTWSTFTPPVRTDTSTGECTERERDTDTTSDRQRRIHTYITQIGKHLKEEKWGGRKQLKETAGKVWTLWRAKSIWMTSRKESAALLPAIGANVQGCWTLMHIFISNFTARTERDIMGWGSTLTTCKPWICTAVFLCLVWFPLDLVFKCHHNKNRVLNISSQGHRGKHPLPDVPCLCSFFGRHTHEVEEYVGVRVSSTSTCRAVALTDGSTGGEKDQWGVKETLWFLNFSAQRQYIMKETCTTILKARDQHS